MRFVDETTIEIQSGHGGAGAVSFRREKYVPRGGPNGGDGGEGGHVIFVASNQLDTLRDLRYARVFKAGAGEAGSGNNKTGKNGDSITIRVPTGTVIRDFETGEILADLSNEAATWIAARGGRGGKGNAHFVSSTFQAPRFSQPGLPGLTRKLRLELKVLADIGIIGMPNAGKSTLISTISHAKPKIADYPFTTLSPALGVVEFEDYSRAVFADIPGLVEGAHRGEGLGHRFLKHIERTSMFVHLLDGAQILETPEGVEAIVKNYEIIRNELKLFNEALLAKAEIVVLNKIDLLAKEQVETAISLLAAHLRHEPRTILAISTATGEGLPRFLRVIHQALAPAPAAETSGLTVKLPDGREVKARENSRESRNADTGTSP